MKFRKLKKRIKKQGYQSWKECALSTSRFIRKPGAKFPHVKYVHQLIIEDHI